MAVEFGRSYVLDEFRLEPEKRTLQRHGTQVRLANRPFQVLVYLIENRDRLIKRDELLGKFWDGREVYDEALTKAVGAIRKALQEPPENPRFIETRWAEGYRFIGNLEERRAPTIIEIEKTREVKFVFEDLSDSPAANDLSRQTQNLDSKNSIAEVQPANVAANNFVMGATKLFSRKAIIFTCTVLVLTAGAIIFQRSQNNQSQISQLAPVKSIAVLPFKNLTGETANDYLADGVTESIINEVSRVESLRVVSRGAVFQFKDKETAPEEIAAKLNVEMILEGGVRRVGDRVLVEARLVNPRDNSVLWASDAEEKNIAEIFAIQENIVCGLTAKLGVKSCGENPATGDARSVGAYQAYLKGLAFRNRYELPKAVEFFKESLRLEPDYALAHEGLATVYTLMEVNSQVVPQTAAPLAEFHAAKALELDANLVGAYLALGTIKTLRNYDLNERIRYYREAVRRNPNYPTARRWLATALLAQGKFEETETELLRAQESDPLSVGVRLNLAELYLYWRKPDKAIEQVNMMLIAAPENAGTHDLLAKAYLQKGMLTEAAAEFEKSNPNNPPIPILMTTGKVDEARRAAESFAESETAAVSPYVVGCVFAGIGDKEKALYWLEKAYELRQADLISMKIDPAFDNLRDDARFQDLQRRVGL